MASGGGGHESFFFFFFFFFLCSQWPDSAPVFAGGPMGGRERTATAVREGGRESEPKKTKTTTTTAKYGD
jgi:hypothetical protein